MNLRAIAIAEIESLNVGVPGEPRDTEYGRNLLLQLMGEMGLNALRDDAVIRLAELHRLSQER